MKPRRQYVPTRFGPETRFDLEPNIATPPSIEPDAELEELRRKLVRRFVTETTSPTALAWAAGNPLLLLPTLAEEMAATARLRADKQDRIRIQSASILPSFSQKAEVSV